QSQKRTERNFEQAFKDLVKLAESTRNKLSKELDSEISIDEI
ncbi:27490_t:CDS:2, partial [Gigaspora margarita]